MPLVELHVILKRQLISEKRTIFCLYIKKYIMILVNGCKIRSMLWLTLSKEECNFTMNGQRNHSLEFTYVNEIL